MAVQSSAPSLPPFLKRAHIRKPISGGQMITKTIDGMYTRYALLSFGLNVGAGTVAFCDMAGFSRNDSQRRPKVSQDGLALRPDMETDTVKKERDEPTAGCLGRLLCGCSPWLLREAC